MNPQTVASVICFCCDVIIIFHSFIFVLTNYLAIWGRKYYIQYTA